MSCTDVTFHLTDGTQFYGQLTSVGILLPYMYDNEDDNYNFTRGMELPGRCQCPGERCRVVLPLHRKGWWGRACRHHRLFLEPLDMVDATVEQLDAPG
ncbi:MAG: hypothetical protein ACJ8FY_19650 [Gemmataceae bacterium]